MPSSRFAFGVSKVFWRCSGQMDVDVSPNYYPFVNLAFGRIWKAKQSHQESNIALPERKLALEFFSSEGALLILFERHLQCILESYTLARLLSMFHTNWRYPVRSPIASPTIKLSQLGKVRHISPITKKVDRPYLMNLQPINRSLSLHLGRDIIKGDERLELCSLKSKVL